MKNNLATNTIALQLNLWYSTANGTDLGSIEITGNDPCFDITISQTVIDILTNGGYTLDVNGVLDLANAVLAGLETGDDSLPGDVVAAVTDINEYFDECVAPTTPLDCDNEPLVCYATNDGPICEGDDVQLHENGDGVTSWFWTSSISATFDDPTLQNPIASNVTDGEIFTVMVSGVNGESSCQTIVTVYEGDLECNTSNEIGGSMGRLKKGSS